MKKVIQFALIFLFGLIVLGQLQRIELLMGRAIYLHEIVLVLFTVTLISLGKWNIRSRVSISFIALNLWILFSIALGFFTEHLAVVTPTLYLLRLDAYILFGVTIYHLIQKKVISSGWISWLTYISITLIGLLGWLQYFFIPDTRGLLFLGWDDHYLRLISTLFDPGFTGAILTLGSLLLQHKLFSMKSDRSFGFAVPQWMWVVCTSALLFTYSRASFVAYIAGTLFLYFKERKRGYLAVVLFFSLAALCLPRPASEGARLERTASIIARVDTVKSGVGSLSPVQYLLGRGWYADKQESVRDLKGSLVTDHASAPENSFVFIFTSLGVVGLVLFVWFGREVLTVSAWNTTVVVSVLAMSVHALFSNTLLYPFVLFYLGVVIGGASHTDPKAGE